jgi:geranylgeranyl pyrophosphate synthase
MGNSDTALAADQTAFGSVPEDQADRERILAAIRRFVADGDLVPPLTLGDLELGAETVLRDEGLSLTYRDYAMVLFNTELWRETLASIPFERRILLLPQCLRDSGECPAEIDEFGLLCKECGRCPIGELQNLAEGLGYVVLVAEGTTVVAKLLEGGKVDAVIGAGCLSALEESFPLTTIHAIPGMAFPLLYDGCVDTKVDVDWVRDAITVASDKGWRPRLDFDELKKDVRGWFLPAPLADLLGPPTESPEQVAFDWMTRAGKRWRPFLVASLYKALKRADAPIPECVRKLAVAVECFHKASLVHDDIEDDDGLRYDEPTLHCAHGIPIALNTGDLLLGLGYKLVAECGLSAEQTARIVSVAAEAHRKLCLGQGQELAALRERRSLSSSAVLDVYRRKTSPAFGVSLQFGAIAAGADDDLCRLLDQFSDALGVAYQILDDLDDIRDADSALSQERTCPPLLDALAREHAETGDAEVAATLTADSPAARKAELLFEQYKNEAITLLNPLKNAELKSLLRRVVGKILNET